MSDEIYFNDTNYTGSDMPENPNQYKKGFAITAFVLSLVNLLCCCAFSYVFAPLAIIFAVISLATKRGAKGLAVAGLVISLISLIIVIIFSVCFREQAEDLTLFFQNAPQYVQQWDETGEIPEEFQKYRDPKYDSWWAAMGMKNFDQFYGEVLIKSYKQQYGIESGSPSSSGSSEELVDLRAVS